MARQLRCSFFVLPLFIIIFVTDCVFCNVDMLGPVNVDVTYVGECEDPEKYPIKIFVQRTKYNRSHDAFNLRGECDFDIDDNIGLHIHVWKWGDGGYKPNYVILDDNHACLFFMKWEEKEFKKILRYFGREESCPIRKGVFVMEQYPFSMKPPQPMVYGNFKVEVTFRKGDKIITCVQARAITRPKNVIG